MRVEPGGAELLRVARTELLEQLLPQLPVAQHYTARMVANAMAIAARELQSERPAQIDTAALARAIRAGRHDDDASTRADLERLTRDRLAVSNPRVVEGSR